jgi:hypothetical protein
VPANHDLMVTTYTPGDPTPFTYHPDAQEYSFYASGSDQAAPRVPARSRRSPGPGTC